MSCGAVHVVALSEEGLLQAWGNSVISFLYSLLYITVSVPNYKHFLEKKCVPKYKLQCKLLDAFIYILKYIPN